MIPSDDVETNLKRIPTHICDSIKRKLDARAREKNIGEFGIGILGFWTLGETLIFRSRTAHSDTYVLVMERDKRGFTVEKAKEPLEKPGTEVTIKGLREATKGLLSGQRLANYLSRELRGRLLDSGAQIEIDDRFPGGGKVRVQPMAFAGELLSDLMEVPTKSGGILSLELYMNFAAMSSEPAEVGLYRKGTRLVQNITAMDEFQHDPWSLNILEGKIEYPFLSTSPGTRTGVSVDDRFSEVVSALKDVESIIAKRIKERQKELRQERTSEFTELLKDAFKKVFRDLPDYDFFKGPKPTPPPKAGPLSKVEIVPASVAIVSGSSWRFAAEPVDENDQTVRENLTFLWRLSPDIGNLHEPDKKSCEFIAGDKVGQAILSVEVGQASRSAHATSEIRVVDREQCGELSNVTVVPRVGVVWPGHSRNLTAICTDAQGIHIPSVVVQWLCPPTHGTFSSTAGLKATFQTKSDAPLGAMSIKVIAKTKSKQVEGSATLYLVSPQRLGEKFPPYLLSPEPLYDWRSRWVAESFQLNVNSEHADYKRAKNQGLDLGYIGMLYAKELVLLNFGKNTPSEELLEHLVEVESLLLPLILGEMKT